MTCTPALEEVENDAAGAGAMGKFLADFIASSEYSSDLGRGVCNISGGAKIAQLLRGAVVSTNTSDSIVAFPEHTVSQHLRDARQR